MAVYHLRRPNGSELGPLAAKDLQALAQAGRISPEDLIRKSGAEGWHPARQVRGLFPAESPTATGAGGSEKAAKGKGDWFFEQGGQRSGPVTRWMLHQMASDGTLAGTTPVWREGMPCAVALESVVATSPVMAAVPGQSQPSPEGESSSPRHAPVSLGVLPRALILLELAAFTAGACWVIWRSSAPSWFWEYGGVASLAVCATTPGVVWTACRPISGGMHKKALGSVGLALLAMLLVGTTLVVDHLEARDAFQKIDALRRDIDAKATDGDFESALGHLTGVSRLVDKHVVALGPNHASKIGAWSSAKGKELNRGHALAQSARLDMLIQTDPIDMAAAKDDARVLQRDRENDIEEARRRFLGSDSVGRLRKQARDGFIVPPSDGYYMMLGRTTGDFREPARLSDEAALAQALRGQRQRWESEIDRLTAVIEGGLIHLDPGEQAGVRRRLDSSLDRKREAELTTKQRTGPEEAVAPALRGGTSPAVATDEGALEVALRDCDDALRELQQQNDKPVTPEHVDQCRRLVSRYERAVPRALAEYQRLLKARGGPAVPRGPRMPPQVGIPETMRAMSERLRQHQEKVANAASAFRHLERRAAEPKAKATYRMALTDADLYREDRAKLEYSTGHTAARNGSAEAYASGLLTMPLPFTTGDDLLILVEVNEDWDRKSVAVARRLTQNELIARPYLKGIRLPRSEVSLTVRDRKLPQQQIDAGERNARREFLRSLPGKLNVYLWTEELGIVEAAFESRDEAGVPFAWRRTQRFANRESLDTAIQESTRSEPATPGRDVASVCRRCDGRGTLRIDELTPAERDRLIGPALTQPGTTVRRVVPSCPDCRGTGKRR